MWRRVERLGCAGAALLALVTLDHDARAACQGADVIDTIPPDGAISIPTNTPLLATYELGAFHNGEQVIVTRFGGQPERLAATFSSAVRTLSARLPSGAFEANAQYSVEWPALSTADDEPRVGKGAFVTFTVGAGPDMSAPSFEGLTAVRWDFEREYDSCSDTESERYVFDLRLSKPDFSGGVELLTVLAFQTEGPTLKRSETGLPVPEPIFTGRYTGKDWLRVKRPIADGAGRVCFSAIVQAPSGFVSGGAEREVCTETARPPFFDGCQLGRSRSTRGNSYALLLLLGAGLVGRARRGGPSREA